MTVGDLSVGRLYRGSSPVNPELGRNIYADSLVKAAGVKTVLNLADNEDTMKAYEGYGESWYAGRNVKCLDLGVDFSDPALQAGLKEGLVWLSAQEGPYYIHCNEGKDRAGFVSALLECLCGASVTEITEDYMTSFENYYHVEKGSEQWDYIAGSNILKTLQTIAGVDSTKALAGVDLRQAAQDYLTTTLGMAVDEVIALRAALTE